MEGSAIRKGRFLVTDSPAKPHSPFPEEQFGKGKDAFTPKTATQTAFHGAVVESLNALQVERAPPPQAKVSMKVFRTFQSTLDQQFSSLMQMHREVMLAMLRQDAVRGNQTLLLMRENEELVQELAQLRDR